MKEFLRLASHMKAVTFCDKYYLLVIDSIPQTSLLSNSLEAAEYVPHQVFTQANRETEGEIIVEWDLVVNPSCCFLGLDSWEHLRFSFVIRSRPAVCIYISTFKWKHHTSEVTHDLFSWDLGRSSEKSAKRRGGRASREQGHIEFSFEPYYLQSEATEVNKEEFKSSAWN